MGVREEVWRRCAFRGTRLEEGVSSMPHTPQTPWSGLLRAQVGNSPLFSCLRRCEREELVNLWGTGTCCLDESASRNSPWLPPPPAASCYTCAVAEFDHYPWELVGSFQLGGGFLKEVSVTWHQHCLWVPGPHHILIAVSVRACMVSMYPEPRANA